MVIDEAAKRLNLTRTVFLLSVARDRAEHVIREKKKVRDEVECLMLSSQESVTVAELFLNPPPPRMRRRKKPGKSGEKSNRDKPRGPLSDSLFLRGEPLRLLLRSRGA